MLPPFIYKSSWSLVWSSSLSVRKASSLNNQSFFFFFPTLSEFVLLTTLFEGAFPCIQTAKGAKYYNAAIAATADGQQIGRDGEEKVKLHTHSYCCLDYAQVNYYTSVPCHSIGNKNAFKMPL